MSASVVILRPQAETDLDEQCAFLKQQDQETALRFVDHVRSTFARLQETPDLGIRYASMHDRLTDILVWKVQGFPNHLIFYRRRQDAIEVIRILHGARDIEAMFDS